MSRNAQQKNHTDATTVVAVGEASGGEGACFDPFNVLVQVDDIEPPSAPFHAILLVKCRHKL
jgi:hypothetical protein